MDPFKGDKISVPPTNTNAIEHIEGGTDYLYLRPQYLRILSKGKLIDNTDPANPREKEYEYDLVLPKEHITLIEFGWHNERQAWQVVIVSGGEANQITVPDREFGKSLQNKLISWLFNLPE